MSSGLLDPCEREPRDAADNLSCQERESVTSFAQTCLRRIAFRKIHQVLNMDAIAPPRSLLSHPVAPVNSQPHRGGFGYGGRNNGSTMRKRKGEDGNNGGPQAKRDKAKEESA